MPINIKDSIESSTIKGSLNGNASTATKATQDSAGQQINKTYIKGLSVSGKTITYTKGDGTTGTITTQDTNTTYSTGTASTLGLTKLYTGTGTATDGTMTQAAIKTALDGKANSSHTHNSLMATDLSGLTATLNNYNLSSGSPKFAVYFCPTDGDGSNITGRPNDSDKKAFNLVVESLRFVSNTDYITKQTYTQGSQKIIYVRYCTNGTWTTWEKVYTSTQKPTLSELGAASTAAATTSANGLMTSAMVTKLNGIATNANNYSHPTTSGNKHIPAGGSSGQILRWSADGTAVWGADNNTTYSTGTTSTAGLTKLYTGTGTATDGTMTQAALKTALDGKAASSHTHSYLPLSGGTLTGAVTLGKSTAGKINHTKQDGTVVSTLYITENDNVKLGDGGTQLNIYSSANPNVYIGSTAYKMYHTGNKPTASDVGAVPTTGGGMTGAFTMANNVAIRSKNVSALTTTDSSVTVATGTNMNMFLYNNSHNLHIGSGFNDNKVTQGSLYITAPSSGYFRTVDSDGNIYFQTAGTTRCTINSSGVKATTFTGALSGNASTATKLATARTIKVGNTGKSFDGSGGITFTLAEVGIVSGTSAPSNSDGRADGTVYFRYA